jgi:hypothetical protein
MATSLGENLLALVALQQIDTQIQRAHRTLAGLDNGTQATADSRAAQTAAQAARDALHRVSGALKDAELKQSGVEAKQKSYQQKLYQGGVTNARELSNIEREIEALGRQRSDLDGKILELMDEADAAQADSDAADLRAQQAEARRGEIVAAFQTRHKALSSEIADAVHKRADAVGAVTDTALLKRYEDIRARSGGIGIARIEGADCGGCRMTLPSSVIKTVKEAQQPQTCENCGRLLAP